MLTFLHALRALKPRVESMQHSLPHSIALLQLIPDHPGKNRTAPHTLNCSRQACMPFNYTGLAPESVASCLDAGTKSQVSLCEIYTLNWRDAPFAKNTTAHIVMCNERCSEQRGC